MRRTIALLIVFVLLAPLARAQTPAAPYREVEVCFVLDTTGSMGDLLQAAKDKIWFIANEIVAAPSKPKVRFCLLAFRDREDAYVTRRFDLSEDMDGIYRELLAFSADGKQLAASSDYFGRDPFIDFLVPTDGDYVLSVYDLSFRGGNFYRLAITDKPSIENVFPRVVEQGKSTELTLFGRNLGAGSKPSPWKLNDLGLDELRMPITPPDVFTLRRFQFIQHSTDCSVVPTATTRPLLPLEPEARCAQWVDRQHWMMQ